MKISNVALVPCFLALSALPAPGCGSSSPDGSPGAGGSSPSETGGASATGGTAGSGGHVGGGAGFGGSSGQTGGSSGQTGGSGGQTGGFSGGPLDCSETLEISLAHGSLIFADGTTTVYTSAPVPPLGDAGLQDEVQLQFYADATGTFDLAEAPNASYQTCEQCILAFEDEDPATHAPARIFFQVQGTIHVDTATPPLSTSTIRATLTDITLHEAEIDWQTYGSTLLPNGKCLHLDHVVFDAGCGNGHIDGDEPCDGTDLGGADCQSVGFTAGDLACTSSCQLDYSACTGWICDVADLGTFDGTDIVRHGDSCTGHDRYDASGSGHSCTGYNTAGKEIVYSLTLPPHSSAQIVRSGPVDNALWVTTACDDLHGAACIAGSDAFSTPDSVVVENADSIPATYYVVVDAYDDGSGPCGEFDLLVHAVPTVPATWTCGPAYYGAYDVCDCSCGAWDPDCDVPGAKVMGCPNDTDICVEPDGTCQSR